MDEQHAYPRCPSCGVHLLTGGVTPAQLQELKEAHGWTIGLGGASTPPAEWDAVLIGGRSLWKCPKCGSRVNRPVQPERLAELRKKAEAEHWLENETGRLLAKLKSIVRGENVPCETCGLPLIHRGSLVECENGHVLVRLNVQRFDPPPPPAEPPAAPCPYCGQPLRTSLARQCRHCRKDWHDPERVKTLGE